MATLISLLNTPEMAHLTMKPRAGTLSVAEANSAVDKALASKDASRLTGEALRAAVLLWHDHFEESHAIAQDIENPDGSLLHGILHRREPDYSNARYWFRRVGNHPSFDCVVGKIKVILLTNKMEFESRQIIPNDKWHPLAFMDVFEDCLRRNAARYENFLREVQRAEIECFVQTLPMR
jgi:hypothetical protein